jgi:hypothetical protein
VELNQLFIAGYPNVLEDNELKDQIELLSEQSIVEFSRPEKNRHLSTVSFTRNNKVNKIS